MILQSLTQPFTRRVSQFYPNAFLFVMAFAVAFSQNLLAIIIGPFSSSLATLILASKEIFMVVSLALGALFFLAKARQSLPSRYVIFVGAVSVYLLLASVVSNHFNLLSLRQLFIIPFFFLYGWVFVERTNLEHVRRYLIPLLILVCLSGYIERFILYDTSETLWTTLDIRHYLALKGFEAWAYGPGGTPGNFYSYDFLALLGVPVRRMVSLFLAEPTLFGQLLVLPILYSIFSKRYWLLFFTGFALLLSLSKGGVLGVGVGYILYFLQIKRNYLDHIILKGLLITAGLLAVAGVIFLGIIGAVDSVLIHLQGLLTNLLNLLTHPFGHGIGGSGNFAVISGTARLEGSGESYLGTIIGQLGLVGLGLYIALLWSVWKLHLPHEAFALAIKYALLATLIAGIASESAVSYVGTGYLFALLPFLYKLHTPKHKAL
jgi:hypothetical protein